MSESANTINVPSWADLYPRVMLCIETITLLKLKANAMRGEVNVLRVDGARVSGVLTTEQKATRVAFGERVRGAEEALQAALRALG